MVKDIRRQRQKGGEGCLRSSGIRGASDKVRTEDLVGIREIIHAK